MAASTFFLQNAPNGNAYATVSGFPQAGAKVVTQVYNGGPAQQWVPTQYPGTDRFDTGGVVCVLYSFDGQNLVLTAGPCQQPTTLQPFQEFNRMQLWSYGGTGGGAGVWVNLGTGCVLDLSNGVAAGGIVQTWSNLGNNNQQWKLLSHSEARSMADAAAPELEAAGA